MDIDFSDFEPVARAGSSAAENVLELAAEPAPVVKRLDPQAGSRIYRLLVPLTVDGIVVREITLSPLTQSRIDGFVLGTIASRRELLCATAGVHPALIEALIWQDSEALHQMFADMLPDFLKE